MSLASESTGSTRSAAAEEDPLLIPIALNRVVYNCLRQYSNTLAPKYCRAVIAIEHFKYDSFIPPEFQLNNLLIEDHPPDHLIVIQVKFLNPTLFQTVATIGYSEFTDRSIISGTIKDMLLDISHAGITVCGSVSSGQLEMRLILASMPMIFKKKAMCYFVGEIGLIPHVYDPSWLMRRLKAEFRMKDFFVKCKKHSKPASFNVINHVLQTDRAKRIFKPEDIREGNRSTTSALRLFSHTSSILLKDFYSKQTTKNRVISQREHDGTVFILEAFDAIFDTFSLTDDIHFKTLRFLPLNRDSLHWGVWHDASRLLLNLEFVEQAPMKYARRINRHNAAREAARQAEIERNEKAVRKKMKKEKKRNVKKAMKTGKQKQGQLTSVTPLLPTPPLPVCNEPFRKTTQYEVFIINGSTEDQETAYKKKKRRKLKKRQRTKQNAFITEEQVSYYTDDEYKGTSEKVNDMNKIKSFMRLFKVNSAKKHWVNFKQDSSALGVLVKSLTDIVNERYKPEYEYQELWLELMEELKLLEKQNIDFLKEYGSTMAYVYVSSLNIDNLFNLGKYFNTAPYFLESMKETLVEINDFIRFLLKPFNVQFYYTVEGMQEIFYVYEEETNEHMYTKVINCDTIHRAIDEFRAGFKIPPINLVESIGYGSVYNEYVGSLCLRPDFRVNIISTIFDWVMNEESDSDDTDSELEI